jgi:hypothetical protein
MKPESKSPILVTGAHRTGTTWVGKMLAAGAQTAYISEPLNVLHRPGVFRATVPYWYFYLCPETETEPLLAFDDLLAYRYHLTDEIRSLRSRKDFLRMGRDCSIFLRARLLRQRAVLKDPFAVFSIPWFAEKLGAQVVVTVRHPAAFASSLKRLNWPFDFSDLLAQPCLMRDHLEPYRHKMERLPANDIVAQASLLWRMIYRFVADLMSARPDLCVVRHEDLSINPVEGFRDLYAFLGLKFTPRVQRLIETASSADNPKELSRSRVHAVRLDSRANLYNWRKRLTPEEVTRVRKMTEDVSHLYYADQEWGSE